MGLDIKDFEILGWEFVHTYCVMRVKYNSCSNCAFGGTKVMVFENVTNQDIVNWREIDPHFRNPGVKVKYTAPTPIARFPGDGTGWNRALDFARTTLKPVVFRGGPDLDKIKQMLVQSNG